MSTATARTTLERKLFSAAGPWERLPILIELSKEVHPDNTGYGHQRALEALTLAKELNDRFWIAQSMQAAGITLMGASRYSEVLYYLNEAVHLFAQLNDMPLKAKTEVSVAATLCFMGHYNDAMELLTKNLPLFENMAAPFWIVRSHRYIGYVYRGIGEHGKGLEHFNQGIAVAAAANIRQELAFLYQDVALVYRELGDNKNGRRYLLRSLAAQRKLGNKEGISTAAANLANLYLERNQPGRAEKYVRQARMLYRELGFTAHEAWTWGQSGEIWKQRGDFERASRCYRKGIFLLRQSEHKLYLAKIYEAYGLACREAGQLDRALLYLKRSLRLLIESNHRAYLYDVHESLSIVYTDLGEPAKAFTHYRKYIRLKEEHINGSKVLEAGRVEMREQIEKLTVRLQAEQAQAALLQEHIERKEAELRTLTLNLIKDEATKKPRKRGKSALMVTSPGKKQSIELSSNWETFARQFHKVHYDFYTGLIRRYPNLTSTEIKVCSLIRIGLSSKEIADILCVSKGTIDKHRVRIHKKLELVTGSSLSGFIAHM